MGRKIKLILLEDVEGVGKALDIVEVAAGYGRNYLIPSKKAIEATPQNLNWRKQLLEAEEAKKRRILEMARQLADKLSKSVLQIPVQVGRDGKIFGSITPLTIVQAIKQQFGYEVDRRYIELVEEARTVGTYQAKFILPDGSETFFVFEVVPQ